MLFVKRKISFCTDELLVKIKASDVWLWQFSKRHGNAYGCTFGEGIGVPTVELSLFVKSCLGWSQGASLFSGLRGFFYILL